jgi:hypothetical protein
MLWAPTIKQFGIAHNEDEPGIVEFVILWLIIVMFLTICRKRPCFKHKQLSINLLSFECPFLLQVATPSLGIRELKDPESEKNIFHDTSHQAAYLQCLHGMPIVFDAGASPSCTPLIKDFVGEVWTPRVKLLKDLNRDITVVGEGTIEWKIFDVDGVTWTMQTNALYVPEGNIRLFSPQVYFQEQKRGCSTLGQSGITWKLKDSTGMRFPYAHGSNLLIMLTKTSDEDTLTFGLTYSDLQLLVDPVVVSSYLGVADETNQNFTSSQKEFLLRNWRFGHINMQWVQMLTAKPRNDNLPILYTKHPTVSSCCQPLCLAYQLAKQTRQTSDKSQIVPVPDKEMMLKRTHLRPGQIVLIDQYMGSTPGRLQHTKGKEPLKDKYTGGTIFVYHAIGFIFVQSQVSLNSGETTVLKKVFEAISTLYGVQVKAYHANNVPFNS